MDNQKSKSIVKKEKNGVIEFVKRYWFLIFIVVFALLKQILVSGIPLKALANNPYDDCMMVEMIKNVLSGNWLGIYSSNVLVKGSFFPLLVAFTNELGISYMGCMTFIYTLSCIFFTYCIKSIFKSKKSLCLIYLFLLFTPITYALWTYQRVYRNGITLAQVLLVIGSLFAMYERRKKGTFAMLPWGIFGGLVLGSMWQTREDGIWIIPLVLGVILFIIVSLLIQRKKMNTKTLLTKIVIAITPIIMLLGVNTAVKCINQLNYGTFSYNEINNGHFGKAIQALYSVKTEEDIPYVTVTRNKLNKVYEASATLASIKPTLEKSMDIWDVCDRNPGDTQVEDGWFWWALKQGVEEAGYYTDAKTSDAFYQKVCEEITLAQQNGVLEKQATMPSKLMSPWKARYAGELVSTMVEELKYVTTYETVEATAKPSNSDGADGIRLFESVTNDLAIHPKEDKNKLQLKGWYVITDEREYTLKLVNEKEEELVALERLPSEDIHNSFKASGEVYENCKTARFEVKTDTMPAYEQLFIAAYDRNQQLIEKTEITKANANESITGKNSLGSIDKISLGTDDIYAKYAQKHVNRANFVAKIYAKTGLPLAIISLIAYLAITVLWITKYRKDQKYLSTWLLLTGILLSFIVLLGGVAYNHITSCYSIFYMYLSGAYPLLVAFIGISIMYVIENYKDSYRKVEK